MYGYYSSMLSSAATILTVETHHGTSVYHGVSPPILHVFVLLHYYIAILDFDV